MSSGRRGGSPDPADDDDLLSKGCTMPTIEATLSELELEFDQQLTAVMDNLFGDEFAGLQDLQPIATISTPLTASNGGIVSLLASESVSTAPPSESIMKTSRRDYTNSSPNNVYNSPNIDTIARVRTTSATRSSTSGFSNSTGNPPRLNGSGLVSSDVNHTITRSTKLPAPLREPFSEPPQSSGPETIARSTHPSSLFAESTLRRKDEAVADPKLATLQPGVEIGDMHGDGFTQTASTQIFGTGGVPRRSVLPKFSVGSEVAHTAFSGLSHLSQTSSRSMPVDTAAAAATLPNMQTALFNADVEMSCSDSVPKTFLGFSDGSFQVNDTLNGTGWYQVPSAIAWTPMGHQAHNFTFTSSTPSFDLNCPPQAPVTVPELYPIAGSEIDNTTPNYSSQPGLPPMPFTLPHPSIFELIQIETHGPISSATSYVIPPATVPDHVWQDEIAREQLRNSQRSVSQRPRRARVPAPYFIRTPLVLKQGLRRKKADENPFSFLAPVKPDDSRNKPYVRPTRRYTFNTRDDVYSETLQERPPSPAPSCSSVGSSSGASFSSTSSSPSYYGRKLSSPPPFRQRLHHQKCVDEPGGVLTSALKSMSWLWSWQS
ncbi:hypothetical protein C8R44DRAFT_973599 [Mycena epipterygia]|nr:hypothetical protein C8R44DRAFT_973599 [Mycena epipterygia]